MKKIVEDPEQFKIALNTGYISPCPYANNCGAYKLSDGIAEDGTRYTRGCNGNFFWCGSPRI